MSRFKLVPQSMGSGWISLHVAVDERYRWENSSDEVYLTLDAQNADEVCREIDKLVIELQDLKGQARRKFAGWKDHHVNR